LCGFSEESSAFTGLNILSIYVQKKKKLTDIGSIGLQGYWIMDKDLRSKELWITIDLIDQSTSDTKIFQKNMPYKSRIAEF
jgi:hypothetical protein